MVGIDDRSERGGTAGGSVEEVHVVASFRPDGDDGGLDASGDHQRDIRHLGRDAARRAVVVGAVVGVGVAAVVAVVVWLVADPAGTVAFASAVGAGVFAAAVGGLWGAFSRLGGGADWREAVLQAPVTPMLSRLQSRAPTTGAAWSATTPCPARPCMAGPAST
jgi:hypothetical protein